MAKVGRNDPCPCGSGKKYKHCCLLKQAKPKDQRITEIVQEQGYPDKVGELLRNAYRFIMDRRIAGMCHALSSILFVGLTELGFSPEICIGEVDDPLLRTKRFDHSWLLLDGKIIDIAISLAILDPVRRTAQELTGPVILDEDISTGQKCELLYGVEGIGLRGLAPETRFVMDTPFVSFMDQGHLWDALKAIYPCTLDIATVKARYGTVERKYIVNPGVWL